MAVGTSRTVGVAGTTSRSVDLHEDGLLWLINRCVFHPRGFALAHIRGTDEWSLLGDGDEVWAFSGTDDDECFAAAEACLERIREIEGATHDSGPSEC